MQLSYMVYPAVWGMLEKYILKSLMKVKEKKMEGQEQEGRVWWKGQSVEDKQI